MSEQQAYSLAELCIVAAAEAWRNDGEIIASGMGLIPRLGAGLAMLTFNPDLMMTDSESLLLAEPAPVGPRGDYELKVEGWMPFFRVFDTLWSGRRHAMTSPTQIDRFGHCNISFIGDAARPKVQLLGVRGIPGNTINHACSYFVPNHGPRVFVERVDMASGVGYYDTRWQPGVNRDFMDLRRVITNLAVIDFEGPNHCMRLRSLHPGVSVEEVEKLTPFRLARDAEVAQTPIPTAGQLQIISERLDPHNLRAGVFKN